jgi:ligand-binding SRPBCC domain-containing protein
MLHRFTTEQWLPFPIERVFSFLADPQNLPLLMPPWQKVCIEQARLVSQTGNPAFAETGSTILLTFRPVPGLPFRQKWLAIISDFAPNDYFCDTQQSGPFAYWNHCHHLRKQERVGIIGTHITDEIEYEMKLGALGELLHTLFVRRQMHSLFRHRQGRAMQLLSGPTE